MLVITKPLPLAATKAPSANGPELQPRLGLLSQFRLEMARLSFWELVRAVEAGQDHEPSAQACRQAIDRLLADIPQREAEQPA